MPLNYGESALKDGWQVNATQLFGILLHPDGEVDTFKFMVENVKIDDPNHPVLGTWRQLLFVMIVVTLFASNLPIALRMVFKRPKQLVGWFCLTPPVFALIWGFFSSIGLLYEMANCRQIVWLLAFSLTLSSISNSGIMLQKAYLIMFRQRWVLIVGIIFILPQISIFILTWEICPVTYDVNRGCTFYYPYYLPLIWMAVEAPSCVMFSLIFSYVAYKQYKLFGSDVWKRLARDGILLMCTAILCKLYAVPLSSSIYSAYPPRCLSPLTGLFHRRSSIQL
ncbi:hypothetical protein BDF22DRAFT_114314 [Syncephalis plumigaleata]|nr:hypothetical protein BDF22DRAFT_114314 [Syncephalis plumigaleata]